MSGFLLDTNCISEVVRPAPARRLLDWMEGVEEELLYLSVLTMGEIRKGVAGLAAGRRRARLEAWLEVDLQRRFGGRILPVDAEVADRWGILAAEARKRGRPLAVNDGLLAATALQYNLTIVSRNADDFAGTAVQLWNPWEE